MVHTNRTQWPVVVIRPQSPQSRWHRRTSPSVTCLLPRLQCVISSGQNVRFIRLGREPGAGRDRRGAAAAGLPTTDRTGARSSRPDHAWCDNPTIVRRGFCLKNVGATICLRTHKLRIASRAEAVATPASAHSTLLLPHRFGRWPSLVSPPRPQDLLPWFVNECLFLRGVASHCSTIGARMLFKVCCTCKEPMPVSEFNKRRSAHDGLQSRCRACSREWYVAHREAHKANTARTRQ